MLFAAGFGTRMGDLTARQPKPMIKVAGRPLIDHALGLVEEAGIKRKVVNLHYLPDHLIAHLEDRDVHISLEVPVILETGGGLKKALPELGSGPVFTINTDAVWTGDNPFLELLAKWDPDRMDALLLLIEPDSALGHSGKGDFVVENSGALKRGPGLVYSGVQIIKTEGLAQISETSFSLNLLWDRMLQRGRVYGTAHNGRWCDVGRPEGIDIAEAMLREAQDV